MTIIRSSDLDFDTIKTNLKQYFQKQSEFNGYNFEGAGLSNILDVLAYNTHLNGLIANLAVNESFLNSAQLRSSVVSHSENLGYTPKSKTASKAIVNLSLNTNDTVTPTVTINKFASFTGVAEGVTYTFQTLEDISAVNDGTGLFSFKTGEGSTDIPITEGSRRTKTFVVGESTEERIYVIPDKNLDNTTLSVEVFDTVTSSTFNTHNNILDSVRIDTDSRVFMVRESPNGFYEIIFSDGKVLGKGPEAGNKIVITYISSNGADANEITSFSPENVVSVNGVNFNLNVTTVSNSAGGSDKESLESIKLNAPNNFTSQQRMVTADDYTALIKERFSSVLLDVAAWGGEDNVPKQFGKVFVSLQFKDNIPSSTQTDTKAKIVSELSDNLAIVSIDTEFTDPVDTFLETTTTFNFDPDQTSSSLQNMQTQVDDAIINHFSTKLNRFDSVFRKSILLSTIDGLSPAILDSGMSVKVQRRLTPTLNTVKNYSITFPVVLADPDDVKHVVLSSRFLFGGGVECVLRNKLNTNVLEVVNNTTQDVLQDNAGTYNTFNGTIDIVGVNIESVVGGSTIKFSVIPLNDDTIRPLRQYILKQDESVSASAGLQDFQNTKTTI